MVSINVEIFDKKFWFQASQIIELLGYESINTSNYVKAHIPEEHKLQIDGRNTWFIDSVGVSIVLSQGISELCQDVINQQRLMIAEKIDNFCNEHLGYDLIINIDKGKKLQENLPEESENVLNLVS